MTKKKIGIICGVCAVIAVAAAVLAVMYFKNPIGNIFAKRKTAIEGISYVTSLEFNEDKAVINKNQKRGYINTKGEIIIEPKFDDADPFSEGVAVVWNENGQFGLIDTEGNLIIPFGKYEEINDCSDGLVRVGNGSLQGFVSKDDGEEVISCKYTSANDFKDGISAVSENEFDTIKCIDTNGNTLFETSKYGGIGDFSDGLAFVVDKASENWGYINKTGQEVIPCIYKGAIDFSEGLAAVNVGDGWIYIDQTGNTVIDTKYESAYEFNNGIAAVQCLGSFENGNGYISDYINHKGESIVPDGYMASISGSFEYGLAPVEKDTNNLREKDFRYIDSKGKFVLGSYEDAQSFNGGIARITEQGTKKYIDTDGNVLYTVNLYEGSRSNDGDLIIGSSDAK